MANTAAAGDVNSDASITVLLLLLLVLLLLVFITPIDYCPAKQ